MARSPYKFLDYYEFTDDDARLFFGRKRETQILLSDILVARLVVLFAETGTGKTSLINAGVRPHLKKRGYETFLIRVRADPAASARAELRSHPAIRNLRGDTFAEELAHVAKDLGRPIVLFFDQFEEFFISTFRENPKHFQAFIEDMGRLYENENSGVHIVFSLREDWFVEMDHFRDEIPTIFHNESNLRLSWFDAEQASEAITEPAAVVGVQVDKTLVNQLLSDLLAIEKRGIVPAHLQILCHTLWEHRTSPQITKDDYESLRRSNVDKNITKTGDEQNVAKEIIDHHFEQIFSAIETDAQLGVLERLLPLLRTEWNTKYGRDFESLVEMLRTDPTSLEELLGQLEQTRLIRKTRREGLTIVELAHDYLAPHVTELQERVQAISLRRLLQTGMQRADARKARKDQLTLEGLSSDKGRSEQAEELEPDFFVPQEFEALSKGANLLGRLSQPEAVFLLDEALERGTNMSLWFQKAREAGLDVQQVLERKIVDPNTSIEEAENTIRLLGLLGTDWSLKLLPLALEQDALAPQAVDVLGDIKTKNALAHLLASVRQRKLVQPIIDKLSEMGSSEAIQALDSLLQEDDLAPQAAAALERISRGRPGPITAQARALLDLWRQRTEVKAPSRQEVTERVQFRVQRTPRVSIPKGGQLDEQQWAILLRRISGNRCTPVLGPEVTEVTLPSRAEIAQQWASEIEYPFPDAYDFSHVAQFLATQTDPTFARSKLSQRLDEVEPPDFTDPDQPHRILASLPFPIYLTTNYDELMVWALKHASRDPVREICRWTPLLQDEPSPSLLESDYRPTPSNPLVYHLWGHINNPESLVLTEDDRLDFLVNTQEHDVIPVVIRATLYNTMLLFLGYRTSEPDLQFLLHSLLPKQNRYRSHIAVQLLVVSEQMSDDQVTRCREYFSYYFRQKDIQMYWGTARDFLSELRQRWEYMK
jgi:hypothetical protein